MCYESYLYLCNLSRRHAQTAEVKEEHSVAKTVKENLKMAMYAHISL
jgi:hypothetical protein